MEARWGRWKVFDGLVILGVYLPGCDNVSHEIGGGHPQYPDWPSTPVGGGLLETVKKHFVDVLDPLFGEWLKLQDALGRRYLYVYALTADHGVVAFVNDDAHNLVIEDANGKEVQALFENWPLRTQWPLWRGREETWTNITSVYSPSGGMAHIFLKDPDPSVGWDEPCQAGHIHDIVQRTYEEYLTGAVVPDLKDALVPSGDGISIFARTDGFVTGFDKDYMFAVRLPGNVIEYRPLSEFTTPAGYNWPEFESRMNEMRSVRSGDIVLVMDTMRGYMTTMNADQLNGWHGGPTAAESEVPLMFGFFGADKLFLQNAVDMARAPLTAGSKLRNYHLTPIVSQIVYNLTHQ